MAANGISTLSTKALKQKGKLDIAQAKRQGKTVARDGTITGTADATKPYARALNNYALADLPTQYTNNVVTDNANAAGLLLGRPWSTTPAGSVDTYGFFENQLVAGTWMTFDETIAGVRVQAIVTNFDGSLNTTPLVTSSLQHGSYIKVNGTVIASDHSLAPDGTDNRVDIPLNRGTTSSDPGSGGFGNQYGVGFWMQRGHTITILDPVTATSRAGFPKWYDTYAMVGVGAVGTAGIANDIKNAAAGDIIIMGTYDATSITTAMRNAMTTYTGANTYSNTYSATRISHMFLAKRRSTKYVGTIDSSVGNPFSFKVKISDNPNMAAAIANSGWMLTWTDPRFDNGGFTAPQINVRTQSGSGFNSGNMTTDATHYNFTSWFGAAQIPQGTQFTIEW